MVRKCMILLIVLALAGTSAWAKPPVYFSFASDDYHEGPTFTGYAGDIHGKARVDLMLDQQGDFEGGVVIFPSWFELEGTISDYQVVPFGANWVHMWDVNGVFNFNHYDIGFGSPLLLTSPFKHALLTSLSPSPTQAGETMTLQDSQSADPNVAFGDGAGLEAVLNLVYPDNYIKSGSGFAFTFTHVRTGGFIGPPPNLSSDGKFKDEWQSEGSFSAEGGDG